MKESLLQRLSRPFAGLKNGIHEDVRLRGRYHIEILRGIPDDARAAIRELGRIPDDILNTLRRLGYSLGEEVFGNRVVTEGLNYMNDVALHGSSQITAWYLAPFSGNVTPQATWTAANFTANATELTTYDETTRVAFDEAASSSGDTNNLASKAVITLNANSDIYGFGLLSAAAKSATSGKLFSAGRLASPRTGLVATDVLNVGYELQSSSS